MMRSAEVLTELQKSLVEIALEQHGTVEEITKGWQNLGMNAKEIEAIGLIVDQGMGMKLHTLVEFIKNG